MFMAFTHMVLRAKKQSQNRAEREREREKDTVNINSQRDRDRRKKGKKCCWDAKATFHSLLTQKALKQDWENCALGDKCSVCKYECQKRCRSLFTVPSYKKQPLGYTA